MQQSAAGGHGGRAGFGPGRAGKPIPVSTPPLAAHILNKDLQKDLSRTPSGRDLEPDAQPPRQGCPMAEGRRGHRGTYLPQGGHVEGSEAGFPRMVPGLASHLLRNRIPSHRWSAASPQAPEPWAPAACPAGGRLRRESAKGKVAGRGPRCSGAPSGHCCWDPRCGEVPHPAWALQAAGGARSPEATGPAPC